MTSNAWNFNGSVENETKLKPLCQQVEAQFKLPARRSCRYFASTEDEYLQTTHGKYYRGFNVALSGRGALPEYLRACFFHPFEDIPEDATFDEMVAFDSLIYIRQSTCADTTGCVETYAHELQHFVQYGNTPQLLAVNNALYQNLKRFDKTAITTDIPTEREANIVSKRVTEIICGPEAVRVFAEKQIRLMEQAGEQDEIARDEKARWIFFRDVPSSTEYDLLGETLRLVEKYKTKIEFKIDLTKPEWWIGEEN
jgi:hypothetical protein